MKQRERVIHAKVAGPAQHTKYEFDAEPAKRSAAAPDHQQVQHEEVHFHR